VEAGVDILDTCVAPFALRSSHPAIEPLLVTLEGTDRDTGLTWRKILKVAITLSRLLQSTKS